MGNPETTLPKIKPNLVDFLQMGEGQSLALEQISTVVSGVSYISIEVRKIDDASKETLDVTIVTMPMLNAAREWLLAQPQPDPSDNKELKRILGIHANFLEIDKKMPRPHEE